MADASEERDDSGENERSRLAARRVRRLRESCALLIVLLGLFFVMASISRIMPDDGAGNASRDMGTLAEGALGVAMALGVMTLGIRAYRRWVPAWIIAAAGLLVAHWVLFAVLLGPA